MRRWWGMMTAMALLAGCAAPAVEEGPAAAPESMTFAPAAERGRGADAAAGERPARARPARGRGDRRPARQRRGRALRGMAAGRHHDRRQRAARRAQDVSPGRRRGDPRLGPGRPGDARGRPAADRRAARAGIRTAAGGGHPARLHARVPGGGSSPRADAGPSTRSASAACPFCPVRARSAIRISPSGSATAPCAAAWCRSAF